MNCNCTDSDGKGTVQTAMVPVKTVMVLVLVPSLSVQLQFVISLPISGFQMYVPLINCPVVNGKTFWSQIVKLCSKVYLQYLTINLSKP